MKASSTGILNEFTRMAVVFEWEGADLRICVSVSVNQRLTWRAVGGLRDV